MHFRTVRLGFLTFTASLLSAGVTFAAEEPRSLPARLPAATSMTGKVFVGYQGWFAPTIPGSNAKWVHYGQGNKFEPGVSAIEMWPDMTEFDADERVPTDFRHAD